MGRPVGRRGVGKDHGCVARDHKLESCRADRHGGRRWPDRGQFGGRHPWSCRPGVTAPARAATLSALSGINGFKNEALWEGLTSSDDPRGYFGRSWGWEGSNAAAPLIRQTQHEGAVTLWEVSLPGDFGPSPDWLLFEAADTVEIARLPLPWLDIGLGQYAAVEALADELPSRTGARLGLSVRDHTLGGLLAYLRQGCTPAARILLTRSTIRVLSPGPLPTSRTIRSPPAPLPMPGWRCTEPEEQERWDSWLPNIMDWFSWLPDGAIVHARRMMLRPSSPGDRDAVLDALKRAYRSGVPYFSAGVQHLRDGLQLYARRDNEAKTMFDAVSRLARRIDNGQIFTVIRYPRV